MTNWKTIWKELANNKQNNRYHHVQYCLLKALHAKSNNRIEIAHTLLRKAFTPHKTNGWIVGFLAGAVYYSIRIFDRPIEDFLDEEQIKRYRELANSCRGDAVDKTEPTYMFIFVRQDISPEQQAVQAAHATYAAGKMFQPDKPNQTHFVLVGVPTIHTLDDVKEHLKCSAKKFVEFYEPDYGLGLTAVATQEMKQHEKRFLKHYKLLTFA